MPLQGWTWNEQRENEHRCVMGFPFSLGRGGWEVGKQLQALDFVFASPLGKIQSLVTEKKYQHRAKPWTRPFTPSRWKLVIFFFRGGGSYSLQSCLWICSWQPCFNRLSLPSSLHELLLMVSEHLSSCQWSLIGESCLRIEWYQNHPGKSCPGLGRQACELFLHGCYLASAGSGVALKNAKSAELVQRWEVLRKFCHSASAP